MYLRKLRIQNLKLLRDLELDFTGKDGEPRPFTVLVGENGLCKTSVLQAIALAASGVERSNQLANAAAYPDLRQPEAQVSVRADFSFSQERNSARIYPPAPDGSSIPRARAPMLWSLLTVDPGFDFFRGSSGYFERQTIPASRLRGTRRRASCSVRDRCSKRCHTTYSIRSFLPASALASA